MYVVHPYDAECAASEVCPCCRNEGGMSQADVAAELGITRQAVAAIEAKALAKLRRNPNVRELWNLWTS